MALVISDRIKETTNTVGTQTFQLEGAVTGFETFAANLSDGDTTYYAVTDNTNFEVGLGTINEGASQTINYTVTVANVGGINVFVLNGVNNPVITFVKGFTYVFDVSDNTNGSHPLRFRTSADASYTDGVSISGTQGQAGSTVTIVVASDAPSTLKYYCTSHGNAMGNTINVISAVATLARTTILASSNSNNAVSFGTGAKTIFCTLPASKAVILDSSGNIVAANGSNLTALNASNLASGTVPNARLDADLQALAGLTSAADKGIQFTGSGTASTYDLTTAGKALLDDADAAAQRTTLGLGTASVAATGISNTNVPVFTSGVADDDFLRVDGTSIEGRSASEVLSDIGGQASLTFGISNTNAVKIDSASVADDEFARFTASGLESRSASEVRSDIGLGTAATLAVGISNTNVAQFGSGVVDDDFLRVNGTTIEGRSASELASDIGASTLDDATALAIALG